MWWVIGFMIVAIYLLIRLGGEKVGVGSVRRARGREEKKAEEFFEKYGADINEYGEIEREIKFWTPMVQKVFDEISQIIDLPPTEPMLVWAILAEKGKVPPLPFINLTGCTVLEDMHDAVWLNNKSYFVSSEKCYEERLKYLKWYDKKLRDNGMEYELMGIPWDKKDGKDAGHFIYRRKNMIPIKDYTALTQDVLFWEPIEKSLCYNMGWIRD